MKKGFKRFLGGVLAAVMAVAGMTIGMATTASAAEYTNGSVETTVSVKTWGFTTNMPSNSNTKLDAGDIVNDIVFTSVGEGVNLNKSGYLSAKAGAVFNIPVPANSTGTIYVKATSGNATRYVSFVDGTETKTLIMNTSTTNNSAEFTSSATSAGYIQFTAAGGECKIGTIEVTLDDGFSFMNSGDVTTYTWTLDFEGLTNVDGAGLSLGKRETTNSLSNTLSYTGSDYVLKDEYKTITDATAGVTVTDTNVVVKPTDDWFDAVAPRNYVSVEPVVTDNQTVYNFVQTDSSEKYLVSVNDTTKSSTTAYADFAGDGATDNDCYITLDTTGAKLCDDSATAAVKLVIPYSASTGKITVSGTVTPTNNIGGKWKLVDFGCIAVTTDSSKNVTLTSDNSVVSTDNVGVAVKDQAVTYSITLDLDAGTASGTITNGSASKEFTDVSFAAGASFGSIAFTTNNGNSISLGNDRGLIIPSVTITTENTVSPVITKTASYTTPAVLSLGDAHYVVSVVSNTDAKDSNNSTIAQVTSSAVEVASSDTVYNGVEISGKVYTAKDFCDTAADNDYVFASIISNDNATADETVISDIQKLVTSVK